MSQQQRDSDNDDKLLNEFMDMWERKQRNLDNFNANQQAHDFPQYEIHGYTQSNLRSDTRAQDTIPSTCPANVGKYSWVSPWTLDDNDKSQATQ